VSEKVIAERVVDISKSIVYVTSTGIVVYMLVNTILAIAPIARTTAIQFAGLIGGLIPLAVMAIVTSFTINVVKSLVK